MLSVENLSAGYGKLTILHDISLAVDESQFVAILGPNGSGKSTLLKSIYGFTNITAGDIRFEGESLIGMPTELVGGCGLAYVPQRENVFTSMTVSDNLRLTVRKLDGHAADQALAEAYELFPILATRQHQRAGQLSGGERQMLAIAMGWLARPKLMLLGRTQRRTIAALRDRSLPHAANTEPQRASRSWSSSRTRAACCAGATTPTSCAKARLAFHGTADEIQADEETVKGYLGVGFGTRRARSEEQRSKNEDQGSQDEE